MSLKDELKVAQFWKNFPFLLFAKLIVPTLSLDLAIYLDG